MADIQTFDNIAIRDDLVQEIDFVKKYNGLYNLIGSNPFTYYPVPEVHAGDTFTVSTGDGSTFNGKHVYFIDENYKSINDWTLSAGYGNKRTFTITASGEGARYVYTDSTVPLMMEYGRTAHDYVEYIPGSMGLLENSIEPIAVLSDYTSDYLKRWAGVWHSANSTHSSLLDRTRVGIKQGETAHIIASMDGVTGYVTLYAIYSDGTSASLGRLNLDEQKSWTATKDTDYLSAYWSTDGISAVGDVEVEAWVDVFVDASDFSNLMKSEKCIIYVTNNAPDSAVDIYEHSSYVDVTFANHLVLRVGGITFTSENSQWLDWVAGLSSDSYTIDGTMLTVTLNYSRQLVFNIGDGQLHIRTYGSSVPGDIILASTQYGRLCGGFAYECWQSRRIRALESNPSVGSSTLLAQNFNSSYHEGATDFVEKCTQFSALMYGDTVANVDAPTECESFLFFTDPHLTEFSSWQSRCYEYMGQIEKYYNSTPTSFCLCGGDWLGNSDLPSTACFKLGYIDGFMRSKFDKFYMLVGNHDTNYQGKLTSESATYTTRLSDQSISDLWYRGDRAYYEFKGSCTRFFAFDTGIENQAVTTFDNYGYEQAQWFAGNLMTNTDEHVVITAHILYPLTIGTLQPLTALVLQIAEAFNNRSSIVVNGTNYDFSNAQGKVEFGLFGHFHADGEYTHNGIPCVMTTNVRHDESAGPSFDLVFIDYDNRKVKFVRVGSGDDREVSI